jgi:hypothetical protein
MPVLYDSKKLTPAPFVNIQKTYQTSEDGTKVGAVFNITVQGKLTAYKGSPQGGTLSGTGWGGPDNRFWTAAGYPPDEVLTQDQRLKSIIRKQESIRKLFSTPGLSFEVQPWDGSAPFKFNPRVKNITFSSALWVEICDYTIELEADILYISGSVSSEDTFTNANGVLVYISQANEDWSLEFLEQDRSDIFRLTHSVSAVGKRFYDENGLLIKQPWEYAKLYVQPLLGLDYSKVPSSGVLALVGSYLGYNQVRSENINELNGSYTVTESWIISSGTAIEEFSVATKTSAQDGRTVVTVDGQVKGLEQRDSNNAISITKYANASNFFTGVQNALISRAQNYSGININSIPLTKIITRNEIQGIIAYNYEWDNRPTNLIAGSLVEDISITDVNPGDVFAAIPVLGRAAGPVLQSINTITEKKRGLSMNVIVPVTGAATIAGCIALKPNTNSIASGAAPLGSQVYKDSDQETWDWSRGSYSRQIQWTYQ